MSKAFFWERYSSERLLDQRFCDLGLKIKGSRVEPLLEQLYEELAAKGLKFKPHAWVSEEWFSPDGEPGIAVPFYVVHSKLARLEKKMVFEAEGYSERECMKILRHEAGHAIDNAFRLRRSKARQKLFGLSSTEYPESYAPKAYSRKFVVHLDSCYAQAHPDEDWAETFAVWLNPKINWRKRYQKWHALKKLELVDQIMKGIKGKRPPVTRSEQPGSIDRLRKRLRTHYNGRRANLSLDNPYYLDPILLRLFSNDPRYARKKLAADFIRQERPLIRQMVARWTGHYQYTINAIIQEVMESCKEKKLRLTRSETETRMDLVGMLTAQAINYINSGNHRIPM